ncbi:MAG: DNA polymerase III subunit delta' [bacterium]|nr:MAG: DNA polymerase III subunit delta' [bacterium]
MPFENIIGQKKAISILERALKSKRMPHTLLFHGPEGVGKEAVALELAKALFCQQDEVYCEICSDCKRVGQLSHPDLMVIFPAPKQPKNEELQSIRESIVKNPYYRTQPWANPFILIDMIRNLKRTVSMTSYENKGRVVIIMDAHRMTTEAANSVLKILEEPLGKLTMVLVSSQANLLLPTIVSRCQKIRFDPLLWQDIESALIKWEKVNPEQAKIFARMSFGSYHRALELLDEDVDQKQNLMIDILRKVLMPDLDILLIVEDLVNQQDKKTIKDLITLMLVWFRDAMMLQLMQNELDYKEKIINIDRLDILKKFVTGLERIDYNQVIPKIEQAIELIDRNVYLNLVLLQLLFELKKFLRRKIHV